MEAKRRLRSQRIVDLIEGFDGYVDAFDRSVPFMKSGQWEHHRRTIDLRRDLGGVDNAIDSGEFIESLWNTLRAWGIGVRGSRLVDAAALGAELRRWRPQLNELDELTVGTRKAEVQSKVWALVTGIDVIDNKARLVALTKTLHHVLPDLVVPIDRAYTGEFFRWNMNDFQNRQQLVFDESWQAFQQVAQRTHPARLVGEGWRTSASKIIDNAIVGFCIENEISNRPTATSRGSRKPVGAPLRKSWTVSDLHHDLQSFEQELRGAGLKENSVQTYVGRAGTFISWLEGRYEPRGPNP